MQNTQTQNVTGKVTVREELGENLILTELTPDEYELFKELRTFQYGRAVIFKENGDCIRIEEITRSKKFPKSK